MLGKIHAVTIPVKILGVIWLVTFEASMADVHIRRRTIDDVIKKKILYAFRFGDSGKFSESQPLQMGESWDG